MGHLAHLRERVHMSPHVLCAPCARVLAARPAAGRRSVASDGAQSGTELATIQTPWLSGQRLENGAGHLAPPVPRRWGAPGHQLAVQTIRDRAHEVQADYRHSSVAPVCFDPAQWDPAHEDGEIQIPRPDKHRRVAVAS